MPTDRRSSKGAIIAMGAVVSLVGCTGTMQNLARGYETTQLEPVTVSGATYNVEQRTRVVDEGLPATGDNVVVAVWTRAFGSWVYCGTTRAGCEAAIRRNAENEEM